MAHLIIRKFTATSGRRMTTKKPSHENKNDFASASPRRVQVSEIKPVFRQQVLQAAMNREGKNVQHDENH